MLLGIFIFSFLFFLFLHTNAYGETTTSVNATVKISVCGNGTKEGGEDCDTADLNSKTCQSFGFGSGALSCDIGCGFNTYSCVLPTPTPTPTAPASTTSIPTNTLTQTAPSTMPSIILPSPVTPASTTRNAFSLPPFLQIFDIDGTGKIELAQLYRVVKLWVDDWKNILEEHGHNQITVHKTCDINNDKICDMKDFSILMFYVER
jgi:hypothetical protein